jgi:hypothetical protein
VKAGYLREIFKDPFTGEANLVADPEDRDMPADAQEAGIVDVHSSSNLTGSDGTAYRTR